LESGLIDRASRFAQSLTGSLESTPDLSGHGSVVILAAY